MAKLSMAQITEIAKTYGVRVYTIGVGKEGRAPYPVMTPWGVEVRNVQVEIDEALLSEISEATGGRYFRATDNTKLAEIYRKSTRWRRPVLQLTVFLSIRNCSDVMHWQPCLRFCWNCCLTGL